MVYKWTGFIFSNVTFLPYHDMHENCNKKGREEKIMFNALIDMPRASAKIISNKLSALTTMRLISQYIYNIVAIVSY